MNAYQHPRHVLPPGLVLAGFLLAMSIVLGLGYMVHQGAPPGVVPVASPTANMVTMSAPPAPFSAGTGPVVLPVSRESAGPRQGHTVVAATPVSALRDQVHASVPYRITQR